MPQAIPWIIAAATVAGTASSISSANKQAKESKNAANDAAAQNAAALQSVKDGQNAASTNAINSVRRRTSAMTQTVYTSPLGLSGEAATSKKVLLGQ